MPPAASVAAAQKVLRTVERRENSLRIALKRHKKTLKALKKSAANHRDTVSAKVIVAAPQIHLTHAKSSRCARRGRPAPTIRGA
jgi:7-keto-8-aminopelargonate synthetase-like enzyme